MIHVTDIAREKIQGLLQAEGRQGLALRFAVEGRGPGGWQYRLGFVGPEERQADDHAFDAGGFQVLVDPASLEHVDGTTIDFVETPEQSGFRIDNPNPVWKDPVAQAVQKVLDEEINPAVASHGGFVTLLDVKEDVVYIQLGGGCQGCGMVDVTLKQGIEVRIRELVPSIREIVDSTDHAGGRNPYYRPSKGAGASPWS
ncbi:MAG TPA: iron-sulfur cluster assembly accessory protein [Candidatus Eisenbacteria bacterium]|nr:iron-sulfur cluster assembly accessory protein [Candidatus Eisenbacteria bacterium]